MIQIRQSLIRRALVRGLPPRLAMAELMFVIIFNVVGGVSLRKAVFSLIVGGGLHVLSLYLYSQDPFFLEGLLGSTRYGLVYSGGSKDGGMDQ